MPDAYQADPWTGVITERLVFAAFVGDRRERSMRSLARQSKRMRRRHDIANFRRIRLFHGLVAGWSSIAWSDWPVSEATGIAEP